MSITNKMKNEMKNEIDSNKLEKTPDSKNASIQEQNNKTRKKTAK